MKKGFTLIELLIVIIIIAILATLAIPTYQGIIWKARYAEVYRITGAIAKAEHIYYQEWGDYTWNGTYDCYAGSGIAPDSRNVQKQIGLIIPSSCFFRYLIYPNTAYYPTRHTNIYFAQPGYDWSWVYNYGNRTWSDYGAANPGPGHEYFRPPS